MIDVSSSGDTFLQSCNVSFGSSVDSEGLSTLAYSLLNLLLQLQIDILIPCVSTILLCGECNWSNEVIHALQESIQMMCTSNPKFGKLIKAINHINYVNGGELAVWKGFCVHTMANLKDTQLSKDDWMKGKRWSSIVCSLING